MRDELDRFVYDALSKGLSKEQIRSSLQEARWNGDEVERALDAYADVESPVPVPKPRRYVSAREAFVYLVLFSTLYLSAISLGRLLFQFVNLAFPDPATYGWLWDRSTRAVRWSAASLLIGFPVFIWLSSVTYRAVLRDPEERSSKVRKWLTYLTLFVAACVLVSDLIVLVFNVLDGELTTRFVLKVLAAGAIAGTVFGYYLWDLRREDRDPERAPAAHLGVRVLTWTVVGLVTLAFVFGLWVAGSPGAARALRLDEKREGALASIANWTDFYWDQHGELPRTLDDLARDRGVMLRSVHDPQSGQPYEYRLTGDRSYELCATFLTRNLDQSEPPSASQRDGRLPRGRFWAHNTGRVCFEIEAVDRD